MKKVDKSEFDGQDAVKVASDNYGSAVFHLRNNDLLYRSNKSENRGFYIVTAEESGPIIQAMEKRNAKDTAKAENRKALAASRRASCPRCGGSGKIAGYEHIEGGRCFKCG